MTKFSAHLLCSDGSATPVFSTTSASISADGDLLLPQSDDRILLAGGFSQLTPATPFPLSATLQLNADLGCFSPDQLAQIAQAELNRYNSVSFRSYTQEANLQLAVLGKNSEELKAVTDTYGGVLNIAPLLLQGYQNGLTTVEEISIETRKNGYRLNFLVKSPINRQKCTYCGSCGPACPENCLTETLFLDFSRCSFCKECVTSCPHDAIDLHGAEKLSMDVPAVLLLDATPPFDLPDKQDSIYRKQQLPNYFSTLYPSQIDEVVTCDNSICHYCARLDTGCDQCTVTCSHQAVSRSADGVTIDQLRCRECGDCIAACPTGALQYQRFNDLQFIEYFRTSRLATACTVVLGSDQSLHRLWWHHQGSSFDNVFFLEYPQIQALSSMHLLYLFAVGAAKIILLAPDSQHKMTEQLTMTNTIISSLFAHQETVVFANTKNFSTHIPQQIAHPLTRFYLNASFQNRRIKLGSILQFLSEKNNDRPTLTGDAFRTFGSLSCNQKRCTECLACLNECKLKALSADAHHFSLNLEASRCVQCRTCIEICPEDALDAVPGLHLHPDFFDTKELARAEPMHCKKCDKIFGTRKSFERVMEKLSAQNMMADEMKLFEYCDTCRVVKIYESQNEEKQ